MKLLAVVISYFPDIEQLQCNVDSFIDHVDELIIWENTPAPQNFAYRLKEHSKIIYLTAGKNVFIAHALNNAVEYGFKNGFTHLLTMDQDSVFAAGDFAEYANKIAVADFDAVYGPRIVEYGKRPERQTDDIIRVSRVITSGSIFKLSLFLKTGLFREDYMIDYVDFEYCIRAATFGIFSRMINSATLYQRYGKPQDHKIVRTLNYSPLRLYFQTRNRLWLQREYPQSHDTGNSFKVNFKLMIKILLFETGKVAKLRAIAGGILDGLIPSGKHIPGKTK